MSSEDHRNAAQDSRSELSQLTNVPSEQIERERSAKRRQIILAAFAALGCAIIGLMLFT